MAQSFVNQVGNIGKILGAIMTAVFFTMLLVTANTMAQSVRERTNEIGVLKTLGFTNGGMLGMVLAEAVLVTLIGGTIGLAAPGGLACSSSPCSASTCRASRCRPTDRRGLVTWWASGWWPARCRRRRRCGCGSSRRCGGTDMALTKWFNQLAAITAMNLRNLPARLGTSLVAVVGIGGVVAVLVSLLSMGEGFRAALDLSGRDDVALILRGGSSDELSSAFDREQVNVIVSAPGIVRDDRGPVASREFYTIVDLPMRSTGTAANVPFRGVTARAVEVREGFRIVAGRMFEPGKDEVIVGRGAFAQFGNVDLGREVTWGSHVWRVVGVFEAGGSISESEVWTDLTVLQGVYRRGNSVQVVRALLASPAAITTAEALARGRSARQRLGAQRARVLRRPVADPDHADPLRRHHDRGADGHRRGVRRAQHDVLRGVLAHPRDRDPARARLRRRPRSSPRCCSRPWCSGCSAASWAGRWSISA